LLDAEWRPYLDGHRSFDDAIANVVKRLPAPTGMGSAPDHQAASINAW
jgi:hypothetical protein